MSFYIVQQDITTMNTDAIVNAANSGLHRGSGVCGAIHAAAGPGLEEECLKIGRCETGKAVITGGYDLPAKYVIHAVGPVYEGGYNDEAKYLRSCYTNALRLAAENNCESIAFPLISSGIFGYPKKEAFTIARDAILDFLDEEEMEVYLVILDRETFKIGNAFLSEVEEYVKRHFTQKKTAEHIKEDRTCYCKKSDSRKKYISKSKFFSGMNLPPKAEADLIFILENAGYSFREEPFVGETISQADAGIDFALDESFRQKLFRMIDESGKTDPEVYKAANISRKLFNKIKNEPGYNVGKTTALALAIGLELDIDDTEELLEAAGYALSDSVLRDVIVKYFIEKRIHDVYAINETLFEYDQKLLGSY